jgi:hypothetical protein
LGQQLSVDEATQHLGVHAELFGQLSGYAALTKLTQLVAVGPRKVSERNVFAVHLGDVVDHHDGTASSVTPPRTWAPLESEKQRQSADEDVGKEATRVEG